MHLPADYSCSYVNASQGRGALKAEIISLVELNSSGQRKKNKTHKKTQAVVLNAHLYWAMNAVFLVSVKKGKRKKIIK